MQAGGTTKRSSNAPSVVSFCELERDPVPHANTRIQLTGFIGYAFEDFTVWDPACPATESDFALWVTFGGKESSGAIYCCPGEGGVRTEPMPYPLVADATFAGFRAVLQNEMDTVVHATVIGTLLLRREEETSAGVQFVGYGHFGCCSLLVIERVVSYEPHSRKDLDYSASPGGWERRSLDCVPMSLAREGTGAASRMPQSDGVQALLRLQRQAEHGERAWAFSDPARVAQEEVASVYGSGVRPLKRTRSSGGVQVFEWERDRQLTTVVVARPYWLSRFAAGAAVAWVPVQMETGTCEQGSR
jgi:hypothetical protein